MIIKRNTKRILSLTLVTAVLFLIISMSASVIASSDSAAGKLHTLGLFQGVGTNADGTPDFDLDREPTRHEAVTMLVRLLGWESVAQNGTWETPFIDVAEWAKPYVGCAYANGLTQGTGATTFSGNDTVTAAQYITFVLRALGYVSGVDFEWDKAWELSDELGFTEGEYDADTTSFIRGDVADISFDALSAKLKGSDKTLYEALIEAGVFTEEAAVVVGLVEAVEEPATTEPTTEEIPKTTEPPIVFATKITLDKTSLTLYINDTVELQAMIIPEDTTDKTITWTSSNESVATVSDSGVVTAIKDGNAKITATANDVSASCDVKVGIKTFVPKSYPDDYSSKYPGIPNFSKMFPNAQLNIHPVFTLTADNIQFYKDGIRISYEYIGYTYFLPKTIKREDIQEYFDELERREFRLVDFHNMDNPYIGKEIRGSYDGDIFIANGTYMFGNGLIGDKGSFGIFYSFSRLPDLPDDAPQPFTTLDFPNTRDYTIVKLLLIKF